MGYKKDPHQKGRTLVLLKGQLPSLFPLINFPFLAWLPSSFSFSLPRLTFWGWNPGGKIHCNWVGSQAHLWWPPPLDLAKKLRWVPGRDSPLALLDWHPHTCPRFTHWFQGWVRYHSLGCSLSRLFPSPGTRREDSHGPWALSLVHHLTLK